MKVEELNNGFKPIEIKLTIESKEELCNLWNRLNNSPHSVEINKTNDVNFYPDNYDGNVFFHTIDAQVKKLGLIKI